MKIQFYFLIFHYSFLLQLLLLPALKTQSKESFHFHHFYLELNSTCM